jgi:hypothetical protein
MTKSPKPLSGNFSETASGVVGSILGMSGFELFTIILELFKLGIDIWKSFFRHEPEKEPAPALALG